MLRFKQRGHHSAVVKLVLFVLPLGLDTFAVSAALGLAGLPRRRRLKISLLLSAFEMAMPVVGLLLGHALGGAVGRAADYVAAAALVGLGLWMLFGEEEDAGRKLGTGSGIALLAIGLGVSLDELAMGFTIGLLHLSIVWAVVLIGAQAFVVAQIGLRLGARLGEAARESAEKVAGLALVGLAVLVLVEKLR
jgi:putative Mn2+ efflux pump MntP